MGHNPKPDPARFDTAAYAADFAERMRRSTDEYMRRQGRLWYAVHRLFEAWRGVVNGYERAVDRLFVGAPRPRGARGSR